MCEQKKRWGVKVKETKSVKGEEGDQSSNGISTSLRNITNSA
jgi:hypothetical protein